jgi:hypothetical protein
MHLLIDRNDFLIDRKIRTEEAQKEAKKHKFTMIVVDAEEEIICDICNIDINDETICIIDDMALCHDCQKKDKIK